MGGQHVAEDRMLQRSAPAAIPQVIPATEGTRPAICANPALGAGNAHMFLEWQCSTPHVVRLRVTKCWVAYSVD